jgi:hypothetical protein
MSHILIVARDSELRRSLAFALSAEGHQVTLQTGISGGAPSEFDCSVLDHHAAGNDLAAAIRFCDEFAPVILLANIASHPLSEHAFRTILKPLLGPAVIAAVREALATTAAG